MQKSVVWARPGNLVRRKQNKQPNKENKKRPIASSTACMHWDFSGGAQTKTSSKNTLAKQKDQEGGFPIHLGGGLSGPTSGSRGDLCKCMRRPSQTHTACYPHFREWRETHRMLKDFGLENYVTNIPWHPQVVGYPSQLERIPPQVQGRRLHLCFLSPPS